MLLWQLSSNWCITIVTTVEKWNFTLLTLFLRHRSPALQITLVSGQSDDDIWIPTALQLLHPSLGTSESWLWETRKRDVRYINHTTRTKFESRFRMYDKVLWSALITIAKTKNYFWNSSWPVARWRGILSCNYEVQPFLPLLFRHNFHTQHNFLLTLLVTSYTMIAAAAPR